MEEHLVLQAPPGIHKARDHEVYSSMCFLAITHRMRQRQNEQQPYWTFDVLLSFGYCSISSTHTVALSALLRHVCAEFARRVPMPHFLHKR